MSLISWLQMALLCVFVFLLTHKALPWLFVRLGRLLGFRMRMRPLTERRVRRFRSIGRGYFAFLAITTAFVMSLGLELFVNHKPLYIRYQDHWQAPAASNWLNTWLPFLELKDEAQWNDFGFSREGEVNGRDMARWLADPAQLDSDADKIEGRLRTDEHNFRTVLAENAVKRGLIYDPLSPLPEWKQKEVDKALARAAKLRAFKDEIAAGTVALVMPIYPFSEHELLLDLPGAPPHAALQGAGMPLLGTDFAGRDVTAQLVYGFRVSFSFAIMVAFVGYTIGIMIGGLMGFFGGWIDIVVQRCIEVWSSIPFLFTLMIIASVMQPSFWVLVFLLVVLRAWLGITYTVRGEFYREKSRDYVQAGRAIGLGSWKLMFRHILPNSLVPVVTFLPFSIVAHIGALVSLDYLGFGLPPEVPSWGRLLRQGAENIVNHPHLVLIPVAAFAVTLFCVVMIGEAVREAFDPKEYARLR